LEPQQSEASTK
jgi:hypothetical protein